MKKLALFTLFILFISSQLRAQVFSEKGYPEHFIGGMIIAGGVSYYTFKKTDNKLKAWGFGFGAAAAVGALKEWLDPIVFNGTRNWVDFGYTVLGGTVGASIVIPLKSKKGKVSPPAQDPFKGIP